MAEFRDEITELIPKITDQKDHCERLEEQKRQVEISLKESKVENYKVNEQIQNIE